MKRLSTAMLLLLLSVMFTIGGSMAYDHAVNDTQSIQNGIIVNRGQASSVAASEQTSIVFSGETGETQTGFMNFEKKWWEPGYVDAGLIQIKTSKDINYTIKIDKVDESDTINELAEVIDVYYVKGDYTGQSRNAVTNPNYRKGSLAEFLRAENPITINDSIDGSNDTQYITLSLKMRETAGNSYQNKTVCEDGIKVTITATQTN